MFKIAKHQNKKNIQKSINNTKTTSKYYY